MGYEIVPHYGAGGRELARVTKQQNVDRANIARSVGNEYHAANQRIQRAYDMGEDTFDRVVQLNCRMTSRTHDNPQVEMMGRTLEQDPFYGSRAVIMSYFRGRGQF